MAPDGNAAERQREQWLDGVRDRLSAAIEKSGLSQRKLGERLGVTGSAISQWMSRESSLADWWRLARVAAETRVSADWLLGIASRPPAPASPARGEDWHELPKIAFAAAGEPIQDLPPETTWYAFHRSWVEKRISPKAVGDDQRLVVIQVDKKHLGESMLPVIRPGAVLVVDRGPGGRGVADPKELVAGAIYVVRPDGEGLSVKRVNVEAAAGGYNLILSSDNPDRRLYPPRTVFMKGRRLQDVVVGRVRWIGQEEG